MDFKYIFPQAGHVVRNDVGSDLFNLHNDAWKIAEGDSEDRINSPEHAREFTAGSTSMRTAFPGHPGYTGRGDHPEAVTGSWIRSADAGKLSAEVMDRTGDAEAADQAGVWSSSTGAPPPRFKQGSAQSWAVTIGQRAYNSPRFYAAMQDHFREGDNGRQFDQQTMRQVAPFSYPDALQDDETYSGLWDRDNMSMSMNYWKAHRDVQMGKYDEIDDPFEDAARNAPRSAPPDPKESRRWRPVTRGNGSTFVNTRGF